MSKFAFFCISDRLYSVVSVGFVFAETTEFTEPFFVFFVCFCATFTPSKKELAGTLNLLFLPHFFLNHILHYIVITLKTIVPMNFLLSIGIREKPKKTDKSSFRFYEAII